MKMKMKKKKKILVIFMVLALCLSLCACGGSGVTEATIIDNEGNTVQMTARELIALANENEVKFDKLYNRAEINLVGIVESIDTNTRFNGSTILMDIIKLKDGWEICMYSNSHDDVLQELSAGDTVEITSEIYFTFGSVVTLENIVGSGSPIKWRDESTITLK